jgi:hypothetical protein
MSTPFPALEYKEQFEFATNLWPQIALHPRATAQLLPGDATHDVSPPADERIAHFSTAAMTALIDIKIKGFDTNAFIDKYGLPYALLRIGDTAIVAAVAQAAPGAPGLRPEALADLPQHDPTPCRELVSITYADFRHYALFNKQHPAIIGRERLATLHGFTDELISPEHAIVKWRSLLQTTVIDGSELGTGVVAPKGRLATEDQLLNSDLL